MNPHMKWRGTKKQQQCRARPGHQLSCFLVSIRSCGGTWHILRVLSNVPCNSEIKSHTHLTHAASHSNKIVGSYIHFALLPTTSSKFWTLPPLVKYRITQPPFLTYDNGSLMVDGRSNKDMQFSRDSNNLTDA